jgi:microcin C transport system permease protein
MLSYIVRRLLLAIPTLLGITAVTFFVMGLSPGGVGGPMLAAATSGMKANEAKALREYYEKRYGLDKPLPVQYVRWLNLVSPVGVKEPGAGWPASSRVGLKWPDLGMSIAKGRPVTALLADAIPVTLLLNVVTIPVTYGVAILTGIYAARKRGGVLDVSSGTLFLGLWSVPTIFTGVMLIGFLANRQYVQWFPTGGLHDMLADRMTFLPSWPGGQFQRGYVLDTLWHLALPVFCLSYGGFAFLSKLTRGAVLENLRADYARTARAKGLSDRSVLFGHVFRNSLLPLITVAVHILPALLAGSVIVERIFSIPGMGRLMIEAVFAKDRELVLAETLLAGMIGLASYLLADLLYAVADPRVSYE